MNAEQLLDLTNWWAGLSFEGKELYNLDENGVLSINETPLLKNRVITTLVADTCETGLKTLRDKFEQLEQKVKDTELEWANLEDKIKLADKIESLRDSFQTTHSVGDLQGLIMRVEAMHNTIKGLVEEHYTAKLAIVAQAEALANSTQWKETAQAFKEIADNWKQQGYVDKHRNDALWNRLEAARAAFYEHKRTHFDDEEKDLLHNLDLKIELAEKAEALANSEEWKYATEVFHNITEQWKGIGRTLPKKNEELWQRIMTAKNNFFDRKKAHFTVIHQEQEANLIIKMALVEKAESMKDSVDWNKTAQAYATLMMEWKKSGKVPHEKADELWKRFTDAQEFFFDARKKHTEETRIMMEENLSKKTALLNRADEIKNSSRWGDVTQEMNKLLEEWKKIGPVPREFNNSLWDSFLAARKHFFGRKDNNRDQRKVMFESKKSARMEQAHSMVYKVTLEIEAEEEKLKDFQNALENITPGKKADELKTHLDVLISDSNAKMKRLKEKLEAAQDELQSILEKEKQMNAHNEAGNAPAAPKHTPVVEAQPVTATAAPEVADAPMEVTAEASNDTATDSEPTA